MWPSGGTAWRGAPCSVRCCCSKGTSEGHARARTCPFAWQTPADLSPDPFPATAGGASSSASSSPCSSWVPCSVRSWPWADTSYGEFAGPAPCGCVGAHQAIVSNRRSAARPVPLPRWQEKCRFPTYSYTETFIYNIDFKYTNSTWVANPTGKEPGATANAGGVTKMMTVTGPKLDLAQYTAAYGSATITAVNSTDVTYVKVDVTNRALTKARCGRACLQSLPCAGAGLEVRSRVSANAVGHLRDD